MSLHLNGLRGPDALLASTGMSADQLRANFDRHNERTAKRTDNPPHPDQMGYGMVLAQRITPAYDGTVANKAARRAAGKRQRAARKAARR